LALGCRVYSFSDWRAAPTRNTPGVPDLYAFLPQGRGTLWIELKRPGGVLSDEQREFLEACRACGEPMVVGGMAELSATLRDLGVIG
ncbi:MAG TPA: VRR-NUC domain-containing protein, partial [Gemmatimonadales bacterium]|nr:VRR-NUC domain-containing protein [Gemmatimonadales bacterium]